MIQTNFAEKYRPQNLSDIVGQKHVINILKNSLDNGFQNHCIFVGRYGVGKTSAAMCVAREFYDRFWSQTTFSSLMSKKPQQRRVFIRFNGRELTPTLIRDRIGPLTIMKGRRIIFIDEADGLDKLSQQEFRPLLEGEVQNGAFIFSFNDEVKIDDALRSRAKVFRFKPVAFGDIVDRLVYICKSEKLITDEIESLIGQLLRKISHNANGDLRRAINELQFFTDRDTFNMELVKAEII